MPQRFDTGSLSNVERTPQGGLRVDAFLTRTGIFKYTRPDGTIVRELRTDEEVFKPESLASLASAPITLKHPPRMISPANFRKYNRGNVHGDPRQDGDKIAATVMIQDTSAITAVEKRDVREVSCGYHCDTIDEAGVTEAGEHYDRKQVNIRYNHVALVPKGRAGRDVRLRLDSEDNQLADDPATQPEAEPMKTVRIDGVDYEIGTPAYTQARDKQIARLTKERNDAVKEADEQRARADQAEKMFVEASERADAAEAPEKLSERINARVDLLGRARKVLGAEEKLDSLTDREIQVKCLTKLDPEIKLDEESDDYVRAAFTFATKSERTDSDDGTDKARRDANAARTGIKDGKAPEGKEPPRTARQARNDMIEREQAAWQQPLATSKRTTA